MPNPTPAKRLHALATKHRLSIREFAPGIRIWAIRPASNPYQSEPLAWGVPQGQLAEKIKELSLA